MGKFKKILSTVLASAMVLSFVPVFELPTRAADTFTPEYVDVMVGGARIGNAGDTYSYEKIARADWDKVDIGNLMCNFGRSSGKEDGFVVGANYGGVSGQGGFYGVDGDGDSLTLYIKVAENETLSALAQKGSGAEYTAHAWGNRTDKDYHAGCCHNGRECGRASIYEKTKSNPDGSRVLLMESGWSSDAASWTSTGSGCESHWRSFENVTELKITVYGYSTESCGKGCDGEASVHVRLYLRDTKAPTLEEYSFTTNGTTTVNEVTKNNELLLKLGTKAEDNPDTRYDTGNTTSTKLNPYVQNYIDMNLKFTEAVKGEGSVKSFTGSIPIITNGRTGFGTLDDWKRVQNEAIGEYAAANSELTVLEEALTAASDSDAVSTVKARRNIVKDVIELIRSGGKVTYDEESTTYRFENAWENAAGTAEGQAELLTEIIDTPEAGEETISLTEEDWGFISEAASAITAAQQAAFDALTEGQKAAAAALDSFHAKKEVLAALTAIADSRMPGATDEQKQAVKDAAAFAEIPDEPTEEPAEEPTDEPAEEPLPEYSDEENAAAMETGIEKVYDYVIGRDNSAYLAAKKAYDDQKAIVEAKDAAAEAARLNYTTALAYAKAQVGVPENWEGVVKHELFQNTLGTGYIRMGMPCYMELYKSSSMYPTGKTFAYQDYFAEGFDYTGSYNENTQKVTSGAQLLGKMSTSYNFRYVVQRGDYFGNNPVPGKGYIENDVGATKSLYTKLYEAGLHDAAGNPFVKPSSKVGTNIFDCGDTNGSKNTIQKINADCTAVTSTTKGGGYNVIIDAEPPTYTRTGNGITPDILTRMVLNKNDGVDFIVSFSEATITMRGWYNAETYLLFNNGARAYYKSKSKDGKLWTFHYDVKDKEEETETTLWLAIALCNDALDKKLKSGDAAVGSGSRTNIANYSVDADGRTITDYVGNIMADRANENKLTNNKQIESSTEWANLAIDNTEPVIEFTYNLYNANLRQPTGNMDGTITDVENPWGQAGKIYISANDPSIATPAYDPDQSVESRPGSGIWHPDNATSATESDSSAKGMVFYVWTRDATPPDVGTNYELLKRFSYAAWDASDVNLDGVPACYAKWVNAGLAPTMVNNFSEIAPPDEAFTSAGSGKWYLHVWTADMSWDSARQLMQYELMYAKKYKNIALDAELPLEQKDVTETLRSSVGARYTPASAMALKMLLIENQYQTTTKANIEANYKTGLASNEKYTYENAWDAVKSNYDYDDAWNDVKEKYFKAIYTDTYLQYLNESGKTIYEDAAEIYARNKTMKEVGDYSKLTDETGAHLWSWDKWQQEDSNWTYNCATVCFDNTASEVTVDKDNAIGDGTKSVKLPFTAKDAHSGVDIENVFYQWVKQPDGPEGERHESTKSVSDVAWVPITPDDASDLSAVKYTVDTASADEPVSDDGTYYLSVKIIDRAGNVTVIHTEETVTVNTSVNIDCTFSQDEEEAEYYRSVTPNFLVSEIKIAKVEYAVTNSVSRPGDSEFVEITSENPEAFKKLYTIPELNKEGNADGTWYVHVLVTEDTPDPPKPYYFYHAYKIDNTAPKLYLDPSSGGLEKATNSAVVTAIDALSGIDPETLLYIWTESKTAPADDAEGWTVIESGSSAVMTVTDPEAPDTYYLHVRVMDKAGNIAAMSSGKFLFKVEKEEVLAAYGSTLVTVYQDAETGVYYGIANMELDAEEKDGYRYSFTVDGGEIWSSWLPYTSMSKLELPITRTAQLNDLVGNLQVKYRGPAGTVGDPKDITIEGVNVNDKLWAVMTLESLTERREGELVLLVEKPEDVTVTAVSENVNKDEAGDFTVSANGLYEFALTDSTGRSKSYFIVVDVYDTEKPYGVVTYSTTAPTNANVTATLETNEPVYVQTIEVTDSDGSVTTTLNGSAKYIFTENGTAKFTFRDAAGNENTAVAVVKNIDRKGPDVEIVKQYSDGMGTTYATTDKGTVSHGLFLTLQKKPDGNGKNFTVVSGDQTDMIEVTENGTYSFIVQDDMGNVSKVTETVTTIASEIPVPEVTYRYEKAENADRDPATDFMNDNVVVRIAFEAPEDGREIYVGKMYMQGAQPLTLEDGCYVLEKTYQANGGVSLWFNDGLGGTVQATIAVTGIDKTKPTLKLNREEAILKIEKNQTISNAALSANMAAMLGGYIADDAETPADVTVRLANIDGTPVSFNSSDSGVYTVRYFVKDGAGNENFTDQTVYVIPADDMFIKADAEALVNGGSNTAILKTNKVRFTVGQEELEQMFYRGVKVYNKSMRYDIYYTNGLYREGQMKYIASKLTGEDLISNSYQVTFDEPGWYTIIIRNQERSRVYTSFFVSSMEN